MAGLMGDPNQFNAMMRRLAALEEFIKSRSTVDDLPGVRIPFSLVLSAAVAANTTKVTDTQQVSDAGPLIITELVGAYKITATGLFGPMSSVTDTSATTPAAFDGAYNLTDSGSGQMLSNADVPTPALFSVYRPAFLPVAWHVRKNSSIRWEITPAVAPAAGTLYLICNGYRILTTVSAL